MLSSQLRLLGHQRCCGLRGKTKDKRIGKLVIISTTSYHHTEDSRCNRGGSISLETPKLLTTKPTPHCAVTANGVTSCLTSTKTNPLGPRKRALYKLLVVDSSIWPQAVRHRLFTLHTRDPAHLTR